MKKIFAVLILPSLLFAQTSIYRSVSPTATALATGAGNNLTVSGSTATFASALPNGVGVGCAVQYDADNNGTIDAICFVHGRTSSTVFTVKNNVGGTPTATAAADQDWSIFHAYTGIDLVDPGTENTNIAAAVRNFDAGNRNLVTNNEAWNVACYDGNVLSTAVTWGGWTMQVSTGNYLRFYAPYLSSEVGASQRHSGIFSSSRSFFNAEFNTNTGSNIELYIKFEGMQVQTSGVFCGATNFQNGTSASVVEISYCIYKGNNGSATCGTTVISGIGITSTFAGTAKVWNTILFEIKGTSVNHTAISLDAGTALIDYVTVYGSDFSYRRVAGTMTVTNSISQDTDVDGFNGTIGGNYNISDDAADAPGANSKNSTTVTFVSVAGDNYLLDATDTAARNSGNSSVASIGGIVDDIIKGTRPVGPAVDIGAHEETTPPMTRRKVIQ